MGSLFTAGASRRRLRSFRELWGRWRVQRRLRASGKRGGSVRGVAREFEVRQADVLHGDLIGADGERSFEAFCAAAGDEIVLVHAVAADAEAADERAVAIQSGAAG